MLDQDMHEADFSRIFKLSVYIETKQQDLWSIVPNRFTMDALNDDICSNIINYVLVQHNVHSVAYRGVKYIYVYEAPWVKIS